MFGDETLVTIGIPTFNRSDAYLKEALESALAQTHSKIEIIVADNCSTDNTRELMESFQDQRIRYYRHDENIGANNNFNFCLEMAKGELFILLHDDDIIDIDFIETCINAARDRNVFGIIRTGTRFIDSDGNIISEKQNLSKGDSLDEFCFDWFNGKTSLYLCSTMYHTKRLQEIGGFKSAKNLFQDVVSQIILTKKYGKVDIKDVKASFRKHPGELTFSRKVDDWSQDSLYLLNIICQMSENCKDKLKAEGMRFFCEMNYKRASRVDSIFARITAYANVYKRFDYLHNPINFIFSRKLANRFSSGSDSDLSCSIGSTVNK